MKQMLSLAILCAVLCLPIFSWAQSSDGDPNPVSKTPTLPCVVIDVAALPALTIGDIAPCYVDTSGRLISTLGTLLNTEVPATVFRYISVGTTEDKHTVKATAGTIFGLLATNTAATVAFVKCENDTSANTAPGTDTPEFSVAIPGATTGAGNNSVIPIGFAFSNAWTCWIVTGKADSDVTEVGANDVMLNWIYK